MSSGESAVLRSAKPHVGKENAMLPPLASPSRVLSLSRGQKIASPKAAPVRRPNSEDDSKVSLFISSLLFMVSTHKCLQCFPDLLDNVPFRIVIKLSVSRVEMLSMLCLNARHKNVGNISIVISMLKRHSICFSQMICCIDRLRKHTIYLLLSLVIKC